MILAATREIVRSVEVPVTADILTGLGDTVEAVVATVREVIAMGAVGVNIEDGSETGGAHLVDVERHVETIRAVCAAARDAGVPIVVNARTDAYWLKLGDDAERLRTSIARANRYREAGASCLFVPGRRAPADDPHAGARDRRAAQHPHRAGLPADRRSCRRSACAGSAKARGRCGRR